MEHTPIKLDIDRQWLLEHAALELESDGITSVGGLALRMGERFRTADPALHSDDPTAAADARAAADEPATAVVPAT